MSEELKILPCPFCGNKDFFITATTIIGDPLTRYYLYCAKCGARTEDYLTDQFFSTRKFIELWNKSVKKQEAGNE